MSQATQRVQIINKLGLHARAAAKFVQVAKQHDCTVKVGAVEQKMVDGSNIMQVMMLAASQGTEVELAADGPDEQEAIDALVALIDDYFGEGE